MKEELVQLAKEKGYTSFHTVNREVGNGWYIELCLLQKWLRDKHNIKTITIVACHKQGVFQYYIYNLGLIVMTNLHEVFKNGEFATYEDALEAALIKALTTINN
jgi:hypothetical protein